MKKSLLDLTEQELVDFLTSIDEPSYRAKQIFEGVFAQTKKTFDEFTNLPKKMRYKLSENFYLNGLEKEDEIISTVDNTQKFLWKLKDGYKIESVIIKENKRVTFCISSQVGCALDCKFCATGKMGILRNLSPAEIIEQVLHMQENISQKPTNIVYMGMGEPMLNYDSVIQAANILTAPKGLALSKKRITISTSGVIPGIKRLIEEEQPYSLAISLNSIDDKIRKKIMPVSKKYPIRDLMDVVKTYTEQLDKVVTFEYVLLDKFNSSIEDAKKLIQLTHRIPCKINVIPCNSDDPEYLPPSKAKVKDFEQFVNDSRRITLRKRKGWEIKAACGQLYADNVKKKKDKSLN